MALSWQGHAHSGGLHTHSSHSGMGTKKSKSSRVQRLSHSGVGKRDSIGGGPSLAASVSAEKQETRLTAGGKEGGKEFCRGLERNEQAKIKIYRREIW